MPIVPYARNLLGMVGRARRNDLAADLRAIFAATSREQALRIASSMTEKWRSEKGATKVADHLEVHVEECLSCLAFPRAIGGASAPQTVLASQSEEIQRRTRVVRIFPNREAYLRLVTALAVEQSEEWVTGRRYLNMRELEEHRREDEREAEGVALMEH